MTNIISEILAKIFSDALNNKVNKEIAEGKEKRVVKMPRSLCIAIYILTPVDIGVSLLGFILLSETFSNLVIRIMIIIFCVVLLGICILYLLLSGTRIIYDDTDIDITTFWLKKRHYNIIDIEKVRSSLYFSIISFSDSFVIITDNMIAYYEFLNFAVKHALSIKEKY